MSALLEQLLDLERRAECARHDGRPAAEVQRIAAGQPYTWPQVPWRNAETPARRRVDPPRPSRFGDLTP